MFQKVNDWLTEKGERIAHGGDANRIPNSAYYASSEAEQAYSGMRKPAQDAPAAFDGTGATGDTGRTAPVDRFSADSNDKYGGRVPYRSQKDMQAEAETQRQQAEDQVRRQQVASQQRQAQQFGRAAAPQAAYPQAQAMQQPANVLPFPGMIRGPEGNLYAHVEYVVLLRSRNECTKVIEYIKANASVFLNMEFIANDSERQRCVDMLSGAAYTLGCQLNKISQRGIYLISSPSVCVVIDPAMQKYATAPEAQSYVRPEYTSYGAGMQTSAYGAQTNAGYASGSGRANTYGTQANTGYSAAERSTGYGAAQASAYAATMGANTGAYGAQPASGHASAGANTGAYGAQQASGYAAAAGAGNGAYGAQATSDYAPAGHRAAAYGSQFSAGASTAGMRTGAFGAQPQAGGAQTGAGGANASAFSAQASGRFGMAGRAGAQPGAQTGSFAGQRSAAFGAGAQATSAASGTGAFGTMPSVTASSVQTRRAAAPFGMQGAFTRSAEGGN